MDESVVTMWLMRALDGVCNLTEKLLQEGLAVNEGAWQHVSYMHNRMGELLEALEKKLEKK